MDSARLLITLLLTACPLVLFAKVPVLWKNPGAVERLDLAGGSGGRAGAPKPPFRFVAEDTTGTSPKLIVSDARGRQWTVKFGEEVKAETFASRLAWAAGYFMEPVYYVRSGRVYGIRSPGRANKYFTSRGSFRDARFERRSAPGTYLQKDWTWKKNPFVGSHQLNGLKIIVMLTSNWDNKDARDPSSNTGILRLGRDRVYLVTDWGASMGKWGNYFTREKWDCEGFREQTPSFVKSMEESKVRFGFRGQHDGDFRDDIRASDVRWLMRHLGRLRDAQIRSALRASGATPHEVRCFTRSLRSRFRQLRSVSDLRDVAQIR